MTVSDNELVTRAQEDSKAFGILYDRYVQRLFRFVLFKVGDEAVAEDLVQDIFMKAMTKLQTYRPQAKGSFQAWLFKIGNNTINSYFRRRPWRFVPYEWLNQRQSNLSPTIDVQITQQQQALWQALGHLPTRQRDAIVLNCLEGIPRREVAHIMGCSPKTVSNHLTSAKRTLCQLLEQQGWQASDIEVTYDKTSLIAL